MMKRWFIYFFSLNLIFLPNLAAAEISGLTPCKDNINFQRRLEGSVKKLSVRLENYEKDTPAYFAIDSQIKKTKARFNKYSKQGLLCGSEGLPHLIADGRFSHAGEFILPGVLFLYIAGYIGWSGRSYLQFTKTTTKPNENEIIINVPTAIGIMLSGVFWPLEAWREFVAGDLLVPSNKITTSPR